MANETKKPVEIDQLVLSSTGSPEKIEEIIQKNQGYIRSRTFKYGAGYSPVMRDELHSVALMAFYEAIKTYQKEKGHFYPFADMVIKRRIIDELRRSSKNADMQVVTLDEETEEYGQSRPIQDASIDDYKKNMLQGLLAEEIAQYSLELQEWGLSFDTLTAHSPKHAAVRAFCNDIVREIMKSDDLLGIIKGKRYFPIKKIQEITGIPRKKLERARIYVISVIIVLTGDYDLLAEYMPEAGMYHGGD